MSEETKQDDKPAFPWEYYERSGITMRDYFAAAALQGMLAYPGFINNRMEKTPHLTAVLAYDFADEMIKARSEQ
jgi:predicted deacylase